MQGRFLSSYLNSQVRLQSLCMHALPTFDMVREGRQYRVGQAELAHLVMYFSTSSTRMTGKDNQSTASHSDAFSGVTENMAAAGGTYRMKQCNAMDSAIEPSSHMLLQGGSCRTPHIHYVQQGICMHVDAAAPPIIAPDPQES